MARVFHFLTESEPFSESRGGAISRWTANVVRSDEDAIVLAPAADDTWRYASSRVRVVAGLAAYKRVSERGGHRISWYFRRRILERILGRALADLREGDTVWVHNRPEFAVALQPLARSRGARLFLHLHNSHLVQWSERVTRALNAECYVFVSRFLEQEALHRFPCLGRTEVLHNGADNRIFYPLPPGRPGNAVPVVLFASRLVPDKGLHIFLEAMESLQRNGVEIQGVVVGGASFGDSAPTEYVRDMQQKAPGNVRFEPYCSGAALGEKFREADIFCLPSCWNDPFPLATLEGMASGLPVVATRSGGIPEALAGGGGILVARESVSELAEALGFLAGNAPVRQRLGEEAYASYQRSFTWETVRRNYQAILNTEAPHPEVLIPRPGETLEPVLSGSGRRRA